MSDLVKRLRGYYSGKARDAFHIIDEAADRIEQLERELTESQHGLDYAIVHTEALENQLAAERALADSVYRAARLVCGLNRTHDWDNAEREYRKARGL